MSEPTKFELFFEWLQQLFCCHVWAEYIAFGIQRHYQECPKCGKKRWLI